MYGFFSRCRFPAIYRRLLNMVRRRLLNSKVESSIDMSKSPGVCSKMMVRRLTMLFLFLALASGVVSGTSLHASNDKMMKCCDKAKSKDGSPAATSAGLCCAVNCSESAPTSSFSYSPSSSTITRSVVEQIVALFPTTRAKTPDASPYLPRILPQTLQPKYILHHSLLI